jgi:hypothetical protein
MKKIRKTLEDSHAAWKHSRPKPRNIWTRYRSIRNPISIPSSNCQRVPSPGICRTATGSSPCPTA